MPTVLPCPRQTLQREICNFPLKGDAFQVEAEGLNFFLHLNHMHKAVIATAAITSSTSESQARLKHRPWHTKAAGTIPHLKTPQLVGTREGSEKRDILLPISQGGS